MKTRSALTLLLVFCSLLIFNQVQASTLDAKRGHGPESTAAPAARGYARMVFDRPTNRAYLFGGFSTLGWAMDVLDVWKFDMRGGPRHWHWEQVAELESLDFDALALDSQSRQVVVYNPFGVSGIETWAFDLDTYAWANMMPATAPPARWGSRMAYDVESDRIILSGGTDLYTGTTFSDTWAYDIETNTWTDLQPANNPTHHFADMVYHSKEDRIILFGGMRMEDNVVVTMLDETWAYDFNTNSWTALSPATKPAARGYHTMAYDPRTKLITMFGGVFSEDNWPNEPTMNETWVYDASRNTWTEQHPSQSPGERAWHQMVGTKYGALMFGGGDNRTTYTDDTWLYVPKLNLWIMLD